MVEQKGPAMKPVVFSFPVTLLPITYFLLFDGFDGEHMYPYGHAHVTCFQPESIDPTTSENFSLWSVHTEIEYLEEKNSVDEDKIRQPILHSNSSKEKI